MSRWPTPFTSPRAKKIIKWLDRIAYVILLAVFILFQAPWKLTLIYAILLAPHLFNTSPYFRKWDGRIRLAIFAVFLVWLVIPWKKDGYAPFRFTEEIAAIEKQRFIPSDQDAYPKYDKLFHTTDPNDRSLPDWAKADIQSFMIHTWTSADNPKLAEWLDHRQNILAELKTVLQYDHCRFPLEPQVFTADWEQEKKRILKIWSQMLRLRANRYAGQGDIAQAIRDCEIISGLSKHQLEQMTPIQHLIGLSLQSMTCTEIILLTQQPPTSPDHLSDMGQILDSMLFPGQEHWHRLMQYENLCIKNEICGKVYEINDRGRIRFSRASLRKGVETEDFPKFLRPFAVNYFVVIEWILLPESPSRFAKCIDEYFDKFKQIGSLDYDPETFRNKLLPSFRLNHSYLVGYLANMLASAYEKFPEINLHCQMRCQAAKIVIDLRRHRDQTGHWPESLSELHGKISADLLTDPSNGGEFVYRREGDSFRFYSKGKNGIDDGGLRDKKNMTDDILYWPIEAKKDPESKAQ